MIPSIRQRYNAAFRQAQYDAFIHDLNTGHRYPVDFRVSETPLFLSAAFMTQVHAAAEQIIAALQTETYRTMAREAVPPGYIVPNEDAHPLFLQIDFAICPNPAPSAGESDFVPRLIELQGFPSLYCFQALLDQKYRQYFAIPDGFSAYFSGLSYDGYVERLRRAVVADHAPEQVVLLEVSPETQGTRIDFACTERMSGVTTVDVKHVIRRGSRLFYQREGREVPIKRIYNRVIRDDPKLVSVQDTAWMAEALDVGWAGHPNWYYRISKFSLPILHSLLRAPFVPECHVVSELTAYPDDLEQYVLKPLFLFSGAGVQLEVTPTVLDSLPDKRGFLLQRKVQYAPLVQTPDVPATAELRMLYLWEDRPLPVGNLVRMSKGKMMGVRYNRDKAWVGSTVAYAPE
jgi:hypothetical protein